MIQLFQCDGCHGIFASETDENHCKHCVKRRSEQNGKSNGMSTTATQSRLHLERMERERRFSARAVPDRPLSLAQPPPGVNGYRAAFLKQQQRQQAIEDRKQRIESETLEERLSRLRQSMIVKYETNGFSLAEKSAETSIITITDIQNVFCKVAGITRSELVTDCRQGPVVHNRQLCMMLCRALTTRNLCEIGRMFRRDHTTALHAIRRMSIVEDQVRARLPVSATLLQWVNETLAVFHALPKGALKGRGIVKHG